MELMTYLARKKRAQPSHSADITDIPILISQVVFLVYQSLEFKHHSFVVQPPCGCWPPPAAGVGPVPRIGRQIRLTTELTPSKASAGPSQITKRQHAASPEAIEGHV